MKGNTDFSVTINSGNFANDKYCISFAVNFALIMLLFSKVLLKWTHVKIFSYAFNLESYSCISYAMSDNTLSTAVCLNCLNETYKVFFLYSGWQHERHALSMFTFTLKLATLCTLLIHSFNISFVFADSLLYYVYLTLELHELHWQLMQELNA